ncbi:hypothetical protein BDQ12DRAFT_156071 [Crucibulum laeve]|uniref:Uncharacterized protein n=1 Tax=Crucibulum laeve TaxID=68775 RepID=A0A5C3M854_9AGAR|nr:hypothetical protein BDQ12DRAFT_156071 [Crucibulum laeve]
MAEEDSVKNLSPSPSPPSRKSPTPPVTPEPSTPNPLKRKEPSDDRDEKPLATTNPLPAGANIQKGEYETGRVICEVCGGGVSFRDEDTGGFTLKHWDAHRVTCVSPGPSHSDPVIYTPESTAEALAHPPAKRRRAKRTEEERIDYLRADPYVARFEAYRVLCASCDKWIRLRPNSTYCSIPWDAHRKSCLSKKINSKNVYALEERNNLFAKDTDVRKFDAERVLCNICDKWLVLPPDDHLQAVQKWIQHRGSCQSAARAMLHSPADASQAPPPTEQQLALTSASGSSTNRGSLSSTSPSSPKGPPPSPHYMHPRYPHSESVSSFHDLNPSNYAPAHESRRRNAEQRAATLRADSLIRKVEPNRVFCSLCQKWVQLRQDSSYCAYPWLQHRGKCLARHMHSSQRRAQKTAEIAEMRSKNLKHPPPERDELMSDGDRGSEELESEEGIDSQGEDERVRRQELQRRILEQRHREQRMAKSKVSRSGGMSSTTLSRHSSNGAIARGYRGDARGPSHSSRSARTWEGDMDADGDMDAEGEYVDDDPTPSRSSVRAPVRRPWPIGLADLDSPSGRKHFIFASVDYLFATTYESTDDMSISALLTYLNAAMPQDKHEDFDTSEVVKAAAAMQEKGRILFEGDMLRLVD